MKIIQIAELPSGGHRNRDSASSVVPAGWVFVPPDLETPNFPFGTFDSAIQNGVPTMTAWYPGIVPAVPEEGGEEDSTDVWTQLDAAYQEGVNSAYDS